VRLKNEIADYLEALGFNLVYEDGEADFIVSYRESIPSDFGTKECRPVLWLRAILIRAGQPDLLIVKCEDVEFRDLSQRIEIVKRVLSDVLSPDDLPSTLERTRIRFSSSEDMSEFIKCHCIRDNKFWLGMVTNKQGSSLAVEASTFWIDTDKCRDLLARWSATLGGDEERIRSSLKKAHDELGVKSIVPKDFFKPKEVPGLFGDDL